MKTAYFVLGMHRSGTSALTGTLSMMGMELGNDLMEATEKNRKGYFENMNVFHLNEKILSENDCSWDSAYIDLNGLSNKAKKKYVEEIKSLIKQEFYNSTKFVIKDPRICLLFPLWESACKELKLKIKVIIPFRNPEEVAESLKVRNEFSQEKSFYLWAQHFLKAEEHSRKHERLFVSFDDLLHESDNTLELLNQFTGIKPNKKAASKINKFLDTSDKHQNKDIHSFNKEVPGFLLDLVNLLKEKRFDDTKKINQINKEFNAIQSILYSKEVRQNLSNEQAAQNKIRDLQESVRLLEEVKDISVFDETYYSKKYSDLKNFQGSLEGHYYLFGKKEGRYPNVYCEAYEITPDDSESLGETVFKQKNLLLEKDKELSAKAKKLEEVNTQLDFQASEIQSQKQDLKEFGQKINDITQSLELAENQKSEAEKVIEEKNSHLDSLKELLSKQQSQLDESQHHNYNLQKHIEQKESEWLQRLEKSEVILQKEMQLKNEELIQKNQELDSQLKIQLSELKHNNLFVEENKKQINSMQKQLKKLYASMKSSQQNSEITMSFIGEIKNEIKNNNISNEEKNQRIKQLLSDIEELNRQIQKKTLENKDLIQNTKKINEQLDMITKEREEEESKTHKLERKMKVSEEKIRKIEKEFMEVAIELDSKHKEIQLLNQLQEELFEDFLAIKESKSWVYTRPIRKVINVLKRKQ